MPIHKFIINIAVIFGIFDTYANAWAIFPSTVMSQQYEHRIPVEKNPFFLVYKYVEVNTRSLICE
jgi:hypothetical protein